jgi:hypothetical protein
MSGSAALSAARKRRASSSQGNGGGVATHTMPQQGSYYGGSKQTLQGIMNQSPPSYQVPLVTPVPQIHTPKKNIPSVPINIYENIELIKKQLSDRAILIQTQGSNIQPEKLRVLQQQNEIQTQVLRQKMLIAQQMEVVEQQKQLELQEKHQAEKLSLSNMAVSSNEPEFIYEKGIPRRNPRYKKPEEVKPILSVPHNQGSVTPQTYTQLQRTVNEPLHNVSARKTLSPFVSMITDTGVIPPPIVILKSHDATLSEHHYMLQDVVTQLEDLHNKCDDLYRRADRELSTDNTVARPLRNSETQSSHENAKYDQDQCQDQDQEENVLLMEEVMNDLTNNRDFVEGIVDKIVNETNLSEVIMKIEPIIKENQELRSLFFSQQQMMNEMNMLLFRLLNDQQRMKQHMDKTAVIDEHTKTDCVEDANSNAGCHNDGMNDNGLYSSEMTEIILSEPSNMVEGRYHAADHADHEDLAEHQNQAEHQAEHQAEDAHQDEHQAEDAHQDEYQAAHQDEHQAEHQAEHQDDDEDQAAHQDEHQAEHQDDDEDEAEHQDAHQDDDEEVEPKIRCASSRDDDYRDICSEPLTLVVSELLENAY